MKVFVLNNTSSIGVTSRSLKGFIWYFGQAIGLGWVLVVLEAKINVFITYPIYIAYKYKKVYANFQPRSS